MSKQFGQSFFPRLTTFVSSPDLAPSFVVHTWNSIFPEDVTTLCRLPLRDGSHLPYIPQRPCLAIAATAGAIIGLKPRRYEDRIKCAHDSACAVLSSSIYESLSKSLIAFGLMNSVALVHHCIIPPPESYQSDNAARKFIDDALRAADCIFTGISSIHLVIMAMLMYRSCSGLEDQDSTSLKNSTKRLKLFVYGSLISISIILPLIIQLLFHSHVDVFGAASSAVEMIYLIPVIASAWSLSPISLLTAIASNALSVSRTCNKKACRGVRVSILGSVIAFASLPLDAPLCYFVSSYMPYIKSSPLLNDIYHLPTLLFMGCDITFLGLCMWVDAMVAELSTQNKKEH